MKNTILYSFVHYVPFVETGKFTNAGILMRDPKKQKLS